MNETSESRHKETIMVVDDTPASLRMLSGMLKDAGYSLRPIPSGHLALEAAQLEPPDLILLDITMPEIDGYEVCTRLKQHDALKQIPVLFISALTETLDKIKAFNVGGVDYVTKPFHLEEVLARVQTHLALRRLQLDLERKYDELRRLEELRDNLTHMIVHDLRSPLSSISGYLQLLRMKSALLPEDLNNFVVKASGGVSTLIEMISSLLDVNRLEAGELHLNKERHDMREIAMQAHKSIEGLSVGRGVTNEVPDGPVFAHCDAEILRRVIANLLGNALKFTPAAGKITLAVMSRDGRARVEVRDTGPGIPADYHGKIFDKFGQVETRKEHRAYSTGLGLAFCKLAVEAHKGCIGVVSEPGEGSTFWFEVSAV